MKKIIILAFVIILFVFSSCVNGFELSIFKTDTSTEDELVIDSITPKNDAYHGKTRYLSYEWWYFDAVFDNNYGVHVGIRVLSFRNWGLVHQLVNVYNNSEVEEKAVVTKSLRNFQISEEYPDVRYKNKPLLKFDYDEYNLTGNWNYSINVEVEDIKINLSFIGKSEGYTYETSHEAWTVALPIADVYGTINTSNKNLEVVGRGYHDHNWNFSLKTAFRATGWYWGKIMSSNYSLTWSNIKKTMFADGTIAENIGILNILNGSFIGIDPKNMSFTASEYIFHTARFIPTKFKLIAKQGNLEIDVTFDAENIQHTEPSSFTTNYWRYFISINGYIKVGENIDYLNDDIQIMEFIRFI
jgi:hypothetical protein